MFAVHRPKHHGSTKGDLEHSEILAKIGVWYMEINLMLARLVL